MAEYMRGTGSELTPMKHAFDIFKQYILSYYFVNMTGKKGSGKPIIIDDKTFAGKDSGDTGRYHFIPQYWGEGIEGQNPTVRGNEKLLEEFYMDLKIDEVRQAFAYRGKMTEKRTIWDIREEYKKQLANWFRRRTEEDMIDALTGYMTDGVTKLKGSAINSTALVNGDHRCFRADVNSGTYTTIEVTSADSTNTKMLTDIAATDVMNTRILDELQDLAKTADSKYPMQPYRAKNGEEYYILVMDPKSAINLRRDDRWEKRALAGLTGDKSLENDPIATGAMGVWNRIILKEASYIKTATGSNKTIARNLLLGGDAAVMAYAQSMNYVEDKDQYEDRLGIKAAEIRGIKKLQFDGTDLNIAQIITAI